MSSRKIGFAAFKYFWLSILLGIYTPTTGVSLVAAQTPLTEAETLLQREAEEGKPVLAICSLSSMRVTRNQ